MRFKLNLLRTLLLGAVAMLVVILPVGLGLAHAEGQTKDTRDKGIEGSWQGMLQDPNGERRTIVQIHSDDSGAMSVTVIDLDRRGPMNVPHFAATDVRFAAGELKFSLPFMRESYVGKISGDHNSIDGSWTGQEGTQRLVLERATPDTAWAIPQPSPRLKPMAAGANPGIEVAAINPSKPDATMETMRFRVHGTRLVMSNVSLQDLILFAYDVDARQVLNSPSWFNAARYDIAVQPDQPGVPSKDQWNSILRKLLAERFQLKSHTEQRALPAYILTVSKSGPKMTRVSIQKLDGMGGPEATRMRPGKIDAQALSMADFAQTLRKVFNRPVIDQTGLAGLWTFSLKWTPDESQVGGMMRTQPAPGDDTAEAAPSLFTALQEQLGLKLGSGKAQVPVFVFDSVEKPSAN